MHSGPETFISPGGVPVNEKHQKRLCVCSRARPAVPGISHADARCAVIAGAVSQLSSHPALCVSKPLRCVVLCRVVCSVFFLLL